MFSEGDWSTTPIKLLLVPKPKGIQVCCVGDARLFWLLIWHCMANGIVFKFDASHHAVVKFGWRGHHVKPDDHTCWSCKSKVPDLLFHAVLVVSSFCSNPYTQGGCATLATPADVLQAVPWTALVREENCFIHTTQLNDWVECKFRIVHHAMSREVPLQFVKVLRWLDQWD